MKVCSKCKQEQPLESFYKNKRYYDWFLPWCKCCMLEHNRSKQQIQNKKERRKENNIKQRAYFKKHYYKDLCKSRIVARIKAWKRRVLIDNTFDGTVTLEYLEFLMLNQNHSCAICSCDLLELDKSAIHLDHIIPLSKGWAHSIYNLQRTCQHCNCSKWAKIIESD